MMNRLTRICQWILVANLVLLAGCDDPISRVSMSGFQPASTNIDLSTIETAFPPKWSMEGDKYVVAKPPLMAYLRSFGKQFSVVDPVTAELVPWSDEDLHPLASQFLHDAYDPPAELNIKLTIPSAQISGAGAFDVSYDGQRMITAEEKGLGLYNVADGKLIGHMKLPPEVKDVPNFVRFCGGTKDMLVASGGSIFRISGRDGALVAQHGECPSEFKRWDVTPDGKHMMIVGGDGDVYAGDTLFKTFSTLDLGSDATNAALSPDAQRVITVVDGLARKYKLNDYQVVGHKELEVEFRPAKSHSVVSGDTIDAWANGLDLAYEPIEDGKIVHTRAYEMFWMPLWISYCDSTSEQRRWLLSLGSRVRNRQNELVLFDFHPASREFSRGQVIPNGDPRTIKHSADGTVVAIYYDDLGLKLCTRRTWQSPFLADYPINLHKLVDAKRFDQIERVCEIVSQQRRLGFGEIAEELKYSIAQVVANRWRSIEDNNSNSEILDKFEQWYQAGSPLAFTCSALRHLDRSWELRKSREKKTGRLDRSHNEHSRLGLRDLDQAVQQDYFPAIYYRIQQGLYYGETLADVNELCRRGTELCPDNKLIGGNIAWVLMPNWFGRPGDTMQYCVSASEILESPHAELLYLRMVGFAGRQTEYSDHNVLATYDRRKAARGYDELIRQERPVNYELWIAISLHTFADMDIPTQMKFFEYVIGSVPMPPYTITHGDRLEDYMWVKNFWRRARRAALESTEEQ